MHKPHVKLVDPNELHFPQAERKLTDTYPELLKLPLPELQRDNPQLHALVTAEAFFNPVIAMPDNIGDLILYRGCQRTSVARHLNWPLISTLIIYDRTQLLDAQAEHCSKVWWDTKTLSYKVRT